MTVAYTTLYDEVLPDVPGVPQNVALNAIRNAVIEFCEKTRIWVVDQAAITGTINIAVYPFVPLAGTVVAGVVVGSAKYNGQRIEPTTQSELSDNNVLWSTRTGQPRHFLQENTKEFILTPMPSATLVNAITMKVALKPTRASTTVADWIVEMYREELAHGAKGKMFSMQKKPWSSADLAGYHTGRFDDAIAKARIRAAKSLGKGRLRTVARFI